MRLMWLFLAFVGVPMVEIALFISVGGIIGLWPTLGIVVLTALAGTALMRREGAAAVERLRRSIEAGQDPTGPIADGAMILVAGVLLLTPGFFTDAVGLSLMLAPVRRALFDWARPRLQARMTIHRPGPRPGPGGGPGGVVIDGEFEEAEPRPGPRSGWTRPPGVGDS
jgi:UPF0716 protein FxsA